MHIEWPTVVLTAVVYAIWLLSGALLWDSHPVVTLLLMTLAATLHSSLAHENLHGHPTRWRWVNELLVGLNLGLVYPYRRYRELHLRHHNDTRLTDPFEDPESYYQAAWRHRRMPGLLRGMLVINNTMLGRMLIGPWLGTMGFLAKELQGLAANAPRIRRAWALNLLGCVPVVVALIAWDIPVWLYLLTVVWASQAMISVRTFAEHQWHERPDGRTIIVERSPLSFLFLNNNLHFVHHKRPHVPWYCLPTLYRAQQSHWQIGNEGYVYPGYWALWRGHAIRVKEPVTHPELHQEMSQ